MPRRKLLGSGGTIFHVINRGAVRQAIYPDNASYASFEQLLGEARERVGMRLLSYCLMPTHFHLVLWPRADRDLSKFMKWLTGTYAQRFRAREGTSGAGAVVQGRYKPIPVQCDRHFLILCRYVERNASRGGHVRRAEDWRWGSLWQRLAHVPTLTLDGWPVEEPSDWLSLLNQPQPAADLKAVRNAIARGRPFGSPDWRDAQIRRFGLPARPRGRPPKPGKANDGH